MDRADQEFYHGSHIDPKKLTALVEEVFGDDRSIFRSSKIKTMFDLDSRLHKHAKDAILTLQADELSLEKLYLKLHEDYGYCESCAKEAFEYVAKKFKPDR